MDAILKSLAFNPTIFLMQVVLFIVLLIVMNAIFWKPILARLDGRDQEIKDAYKQVEKTRHDMEGLRSDYQTRIAQIEAEARTHIQTAIKEAQDERERIIKEARAHSDATIQQGIAAMEQEKTEALTSLRERMVGISLDAASKALGAAADPVTLRRSIEERLASSAANGGNPARN